MDDQEKKNALSRFNHIFRNEELHYNRKKLHSGNIIDLEDESFFKRVNQKFIKMLGNVKGKKILDIGCGRGNLSFYLAQKGAHVVGIDLSKNFIDFCKNEMKRLNLEIDFRIMNAQIPDFEDGSFDLIVGSRIVHHLPDIELFFRECKRILKRKGHIIFIEPLKKNPIVNMNRKYLKPKERTFYEHPLFLSEVMIAKKVFGNIQHAEYYIISPSAILFKRIFKKSKIFRIIYKILQLIEIPLYEIEFLRHYCWQTIFKSVKI
ncbi:MAG: class I SAM-dependent methyltransferase [Candidatus Thorarchaeota archaeon]